MLSVLYVRNYAQMRMYETSPKHNCSPTNPISRGTNSAPEKTSISKEEIPNSVSRVLNAAKIQQEERAKQKRSSEDTGLDGATRKKQKKAHKDDDSNTSDLRIKPGESLAHFNRYVDPTRCARHD